jgi:diacylglycerol O-acyltransferase
MAPIRKLSTVDASFLYLETPEMPMHVGSMAIFKPRPGYAGDFFEDFKKLIASRLHLALILISRLEKTPLDIDNPSWTIDDQFDIDRHIFRASLPAPADRATLARTVGWMHAKLLNRARPLWEFYVFEGLREGEIGLYSKVHHACIDGGAGAALTEIVYDVTSTPREVAKAAPKAAKSDTQEIATTFLQSYVELWRRPSDIGGLIKPIDLPRTGKSDLGSILFDNAVGQFEQTMRVLSGLPSIAKTVNEIVQKIVDPKSRENLAAMVAPATPLNRSISSERSFAGVTISLSRAKALAKAAGGKLNDVVMAISSGVLRRYLSEQGALPQRSLTAAVPISLREAGDAAANNQVFGMVCSLASDVEDPRERLLTIIQESSKAKEMSSPLRPLIPHLSNIALLGVPMLVQMLALLNSRSNLADVMPAAANVTISNVPGPRQTLYAAGAELLNIFPVSIAAHGLALNITVQSYRDQLDFGLIAGANVLPDVNKLARLFPDEFEALEAAFGLAPPAPEVAPPKAAVEKAVKPAQRAKKPAPRAGKPAARSKRSAADSAGRRAN